MGKLEYFVGISLPIKEEDVILEIKTILSNNDSPGSPPHITIIPPFRFNNQEELVSRITAAAARQDTFKVLIDKAGCFRQPKYGTVFIAPKNGEEIRNLFVTLKKVLPEANIRNNFVAHLTLANRVPFNKIEETVNKVEDLALRLEIKVSAFTIFGRNKDKKWSIFRIIPFGNPKRPTQGKKNPPEQSG